MQTKVIRIEGADFIGFYFCDLGFIQAWADTAGSASP
jgi:hypothetical protein